MDSQSTQIQKSIIQSQQTVKKIENYLFKWSNKIGKGNFSQVYLGYNDINKENVAIKVIKNQSVKSKTAQRLLNHEINNLKYMDHPFIIKCYDVISSVNNCYIITEYCEGGDLQKILKQKKYFQEQQIYKILYQTYKGLQYLYSNNVLHRDFKIANIFIKNGSYKIADLGFSIRAKTQFNDIQVGSPIYMSPQGYINNIYSPKTDVWSFGVMIYQLLHGYTPLDKCKSQEQLKINLMKKPVFKKNLSPQIIQLLQLCLQPNLLKRISIPMISKTKFMQKLFCIFQSGLDKLSMTIHSTDTSCSVKPSLFEGIFTYEQALNILHYGRLLNLCFNQTKNLIFSQWLLFIFDGFIKCKIIEPKSKSESSPKNNQIFLVKNILTVNQNQNLKKIIQEYSLKYIKEHIFVKITRDQGLNFDIVLAQILKLYKQYESKINCCQTKNLILNVYKETQLLNQSFKQNKMSYFVKHSKSAQFLTEIKKKNNIIEVK